LDLNDERTTNLVTGSSHHAGSPVHKPIGSGRWWGVFASTEISIATTIIVKLGEIWSFSSA
jgi:hypothetical protein